MNASYTISPSVTFDSSYRRYHHEFGFKFTFLRNPNFLNDKINDKTNYLDKTILGEIRKNKYITIPGLSKKQVNLGLLFIGTLKV